MEKKPPEGALIPIAARLALGQALNRLYEVCENQKSISTDKLQEIVDDVGDKLKVEARYIKTTYTRITEAKSQ